MKREILYKRPLAPAKKEVKPVPKAVKSASTGNKTPKKTKISKSKQLKKSVKKRKAKRLKNVAITRTWDLSTNEGRLSKAIFEWIESHPHFKWSRMAQEVGLQKSNFYTKFLTAPVPAIKPEFLPQIAEIMSNYGFQNNA